MRENYRPWPRAGSRAAKRRPRVRSWSPPRCRARFAAELPRRQEGRYCSVRLRGVASLPPRSPARAPRRTTTYPQSGALITPAPHRRAARRAERPRPGRGRGPRGSRWSRRRPTAANRRANIVAVAAIPGGFRRPARHAERPRLAADAVRVQWTFWVACRHGRSPMTPAIAMKSWRGLRTAAVTGWPAGPAPEPAPSASTRHRFRQ
jgi:hypothetical protein